MRNPFLFIGVIPALLFAREASAKPNVQLVAQQQTNWCWAASTEMTLKALGYPGKASQQCHVANIGLARVDCCLAQEAWKPEGCNQPNFPPFESYGYAFLQARASDFLGTMTPQMLRGETDANRPVPFIWDWRGGGGCGGGAHMAVVADMYSFFFRTFVTIYDPAPVNEGSIYDISYDDWIGGNGKDRKYQRAYYAFKKVK